MLSIDDIRVIIFQTTEYDNEIVSRFRLLENKIFMEYSDDDSLELLIDELISKGYNSKEVLILKNFNGRIFQECPGSQNMICCNYLLINTCFGCIYNCTYCFLNSYLNSFGIVQFNNLNSLTDEIINTLDLNHDLIYRIGTGEFSDSLMIDEITGLAEEIIHKTAVLKNVMIEFKTKSDNVEHLLNIPEKGNTVLAWSLNTERNIEMYENGTARLDRRIEAAVEAEKAGFYIAFHFDPIIFYNGYLKDYIDVIERIFKKVNPENIVWISMGCFRYSSGFKEVIRQKFPDEQMTTEEMFPGHDGKYRYLKNRRYNIYNEMKEKIYKFSKKPFVYLCMETDSMWKRVFDYDFRSSNELEKFFSDHLKKNFFK